jgi:hypothetical protein
MRYQEWTHRVPPRPKGVSTMVMEVDGLGKMGCRRWRVGGGSEENGNGKEKGGNE